MTSVNSHFSSHFPPVYYIVVDIQFARHATFSTPHTHFLLQLLCEFAPAVAVSVFVLTKAMLFVFANLYALTASVSSVLHVLSYILSMLLFCLFMLGLFML